ncbi:MAG: hypothetical protein PF489_06390 [Salinivirgaceae bacterium]|nr:hypothetical protein [Salinivirgaceae bacterium]
MKKAIIYDLIIFVVVCIATTSTVRAQNTDIYELSIKDLKMVSVVNDSTIEQYQPTYEISIQDLMSLEVVKELRVNKYVDITYDIPLEELMHVKLSIKKDTGFEPTYEMSLRGLTALEYKENSEIRERINLSYDISLDGIMNITIKPRE